MERTVFSGKTETHPVQVTAKGSLRILRFGTDEIQSCVDLRQPWSLQLAYARWMASAILLHPNPRRFLLFGLGGGGLPHFLLHHFPGARIDVVEKEALVLHLARSHFRLPEREGLRLIRQDAATFLRTSGASGYHIIFVDIFGSGGLAPELVQPEFYQAMLGCLTPRGVLSANLWSEKEALLRRTMKAAHAGAQGAFLSMRVKKRGNMVVLLFPGNIPWQTIRRVRKDNAQQQRQYGIDFSDCFKSLRRRRLLSLFFP